jgi:hypothetical protein
MSVTQANPPGPVRTLPDDSTPYSHPYGILFKPRWGWTRAITLRDDHRLFRYIPQFATWTKATHQHEALHAAAVAHVLESAHTLIAFDAAKWYGEHGSLISGGFRDDWPEETKTTLRWLAHRITDERDRSRSHWRASGRTDATWRRMIGEHR